MAQYVSSYRTILTLGLEREEVQHVPIEVLSSREKWKSVAFLGDWRKKLEGE